MSGWMKTGASSADLAKQQEYEAEKQKQEQGKMWRFFLKDNEEARITFVDGELSNQGFLLPPRFYEHQLQLNGSWNNFFVCPEKTSPELHQKCPICEQGEKPALVALFTIIDHRSFTTTSGKTYKDTPRLLVAKPQSFELLNKLAMKRGGLAGCTFDVSRIGDKAASIGSMFDFVEKNDVLELQKHFMREVVDEKTKTKSVVTVFTPANYESEIIFRNEDELRSLGFGKAKTSPSSGLFQGSSSSPSQASAPAQTELKQHL